MVRHTVYLTVKEVRESEWSGRLTYSVDLSLSFVPIYNTCKYSIHFVSGTVLTYHKIFNVIPSWVRCWSILS